MPSLTPFSGMDPYLEHPVLWPGVHFGLIATIRQQLAPRLRPRYAVAAEERIYLEAPVDQRIPDVWIQESRVRRSKDSSSGTAGGVATLDQIEVAAPVIVESDPLEVREPYLEILDLYRDQRVVAVVEVVSPSNKRPGPGRDAYVKKQQATIKSPVHLVEVDLLRSFSHVLAVSESQVWNRPANGYMVGVNRHPQRSRFEIYPWTLRDRMPNFNIPLATPDADVPLDLQAAFEQMYADGSYMLRVKYDDPCDPPLSPEDQAWASERWRRYRDDHPEWFAPRVPATNT